jgi:hypothetical protein
MKKGNYSTSDKPLWPDGIPKKFNEPPPYIGLPITYTSTFRFVRAASSLAKKISITTKPPLP